jgi:tetratricopeptide (TPR) repeat protein
MSHPALHRAILIVDVESFGDPARTDAHRLAVRAAMYKVLRQSLAGARISWTDCAIEDRGDGVLILVPATVPKSWLVTRLPSRLAGTLGRHNAARPKPERIRLRMALHAGEVYQDAHGFAGTSINQAFRLVDAPEPRIALRNSAAVVVLIVSDWFYDDVVRHYEAAAPSDFRQVRVAVKETDMKAWIRVLGPGSASGGEEAGPPADLSEPGQASHSSLAVRYSLPPDTAAFTGRDEELTQITAAVMDAAGAGGVVAVRAIDGMPGVGKTALVVHVAHLLRHQFPDRQLFINLHAHTPGRESVRPEDALAGLLTAVGADPRFLPGDLDGRVGMWRDKMAGQRALLVLDNATSSGQIAPLLPGAEGCLVLVTSRRHLGDLPGAVTSVLLDALTPPEAQEMFTRLAPRAADYPGDVTEVMQLAGFLPLAISLLARVFVRHGSWTLADLAAETRAGLLTLTAENDSIAAAFEVSYRYLDPARQRFFCLLGVHPGSTTDAYAAAALGGIGLEEAAALLDGLHREGLLTETGHRRYGMHDLLRRYARDRAAGSAADSLRALNRLLDYYQHTAALAGARLGRQTRPGPPPTAPAGLPAVPGLNDTGQALAWSRADRASLLACLDHAARIGEHARVVALTAALAGLLRHDGPWADAITRHTAAIQAAQDLGDRLGQANALADLGDILRLNGDYPGAAHALEQALGIYRDIGDWLGQANALNGLGNTRRLTGDWPGAAQALEQALSIYRDIGDRLGQANALRQLGVVRRLTGDWPGAAQALEQALSICRDLGNRVGQANALNGLGILRRLTGDFPGAVRAQEQALSIYRSLGDRGGQAYALNYLGNTLRLTGDFPGAAKAQEQALSICLDIGDRLGEANALRELGVVRRLTGDWPDAAQGLEQALSIYRDIGDRRGQAHALRELGSTRRLTGDYPGAAQPLKQALSICRGLGDRGGEAETLNERGTLHRVAGDLARSAECHQQARELARAIASPWDEAGAVAGLGRCAMAAGNTAQAEILLRQAYETFQQIGAADAPAVLAELNALTGPQPAG